MYNMQFLLWLYHSFVVEICGSKKKIAMLLILGCGQRLYQQLQFFPALLVWLVLVAALHIVYAVPMSKRCHPIIVNVFF